VTTTKHEFFGTGEAARRLGLRTWKLLYLIDRGYLPEPSLRIAGRRIFSEQDVCRIGAALANLKNPKSEIENEA